ncbi:MAG: TetR/AcrR family transcriptional regulator [Chitinophagales bacterium]|nr:TetR/AcrR family transcriptional regulator [Chitinophagales bacterium]
MPRVKAFDKEEVLDKAMKLFWSKGYNATSYCDLVEHLGINRQSIYDTFGDKQQLYQLALDRFRVQSIAKVKAALHGLPTARETIEHFLKMAVVESLDPTPKGCFIVNSTIEMASIEPEVAKTSCENMNEICSWLTEVIAKGQKEGSIGSRHSPEQLALFIFTLLNGLKVYSKMELPSTTYDRILQVAWDVLD